MTDSTWTSQGRPVTDDQIEDLVREAEGGYDIPAHLGVHAHTDRSGQEAPPGKSEDASIDMAEVAEPTNAQIVARLKAQDRSNGPTTEEIAGAVQEGRRG